MAPHPSLKPQAFLRQLVRAMLPLGEGIVLDTFAGSGSTLAAANAVGYDSIGVERDPAYVSLARTAVPQLSTIDVGPAGDDSRASPGRRVLRRSNPVTIASQWPSTFAGARSRRRTPSD